MIAKYDYVSNKKYMPMPTMEPGVSSVFVESADMRLICQALNFFFQFYFVCYCYLFNFGYCSWTKRKSSDKLVDVNEFESGNM